MMTASEAIPLAVLADDVRSVSDIVSDLRAAFRAVDFDRAEAVLVARVTALRREIARLEKDKQSIMELRELDRVEMADLRQELERGVEAAELESASARARAVEKESEVSELNRRLREAEAEAERWKRSYEEIDDRLATMEADTARLLMTSHLPAARKAASERSESIGAKRNAGDAKFVPEQAILIVDSDDDCALDGSLSRKESYPKVLKRKRSSSLNLSTNKNDEDSGDHDVSNSNMGQAQQESVTKPVASPANNKDLATEASPITNGVETPSATPNQHQVVVGRCNENTSSVAEKSTPADKSKSFWDSFGEIKFKPTSNSSSSSSDSDSDSNS